MSGFTIVSGKEPRFNSLVKSIYILAKRWRGFVREQQQWAEGTPQYDRLDGEQYRHEVEQQEFVAELLKDPGFQALPVVTDQSEVPRNALIVDSRDPKTIIKGYSYSPTLNSVSCGAHRWDAKSVAAMQFRIIGTLSDPEKI